MERAMSYDPKDHTITGKQAAAAWVICLGIIGLALGVTAKHGPAPEAEAAHAPQMAAATYPPPLSGVHIPRYAQCCSKEGPRPLDLAAARPGVVPPPLATCG
jgi:hypothetical protein